MAWGESWVTFHEITEMLSTEIILYSFVFLLYETRSIKKKKKKSSVCSAMQKNSMHCDAVLGILK